MRDCGTSVTVFWTSVAVFWTSVTVFWTSMAVFWTDVTGLLDQCDWYSGPM